MCKFIVSIVVSFVVSIECPSSVHRASIECPSSVRRTATRLCRQTAIEAIPLASTPLLSVPGPQNQGLLPLEGVRLCGSALVLGSMVGQRRQEKPRHGQMRPLQMSSWTHPCLSQTSACWRYKFPEGTWREGKTWPCCPPHPHAERGSLQNGACILERDPPSLFTKAISAFCTRTHPCLSQTGACWRYKCSEGTFPEGTAWPLCPPLPHVDQGSLLNGVCILERDPPHV